LAKKEGVYMSLPMTNQKEPRKRLSKLEKEFIALLEEEIREHNKFYELLIYWIKSGVLGEKQE
jgi:hypothetical protein